MGVNKGRVQLANNVGKIFRDILAIDKQDINLAVKASFPNKMMVSSMMEGDSGEEEGGVEVGEEG